MFIEKIIIRSEIKKDITLNFTNGFNLIYGASDTGKTYILRCIYFIFGGNDLPFPKETDYNEVDLTLNVNNKKITFLRQLEKKNTIIVNSQVEQIQSGKYKTQTGKTNSINDVWLKLIGIEPPVYIIKNKNYEKQNLSFKLISKLFYINEKIISEQNSIFDYNNLTVKTALLSTFLFLATGNDYSEHKKQESKEIQKARNKAVKTFILQQIESYKIQKEKLEQELQNTQTKNIQEQIDLLLKNIDQNQTVTKNKVQEKLQLTNQMLELQEPIKENKILLERYTKLKTQYVADIKRLDFILDGEDKFSLLEIPTQKDLNCPFCQNKIPQQKKQSYKKIAESEKSKTLTNLQELEYAITDLLQEIKIQEKQIKEFENKIENITNELNKILTPQLLELQNKVNDYKLFLQKQTQFEILQNQINDFTEKSQTVEIQNKEEPEFNVKNEISIEISNNFEKLAKSILEKCNYEKINSICLEVSKMDFVINKKEKASHGKGYCSYLNSVMAVIVNKFLHEYGTYQLPFLFIDSPFLGFDETEKQKENISDSLKIGFFEYLLNNITEQTIIVENEQTLPKMDFNSKGINIIYFADQQNGLLDL